MSTWRKFTPVELALSQSCTRFKLLVDRAIDAAREKEDFETSKILRRAKRRAKAAFRNLAEQLVKEPSDDDLGL